MKRRALRAFGRTLTLPLDPATQLRDTLEAMTALVHATDWTGVVANFTDHTIPDSEQSDPERAGRAVYRVLRERMEFQRDPRGCEYLRFPDQMIADIANRGVALGDCDDRAILGAAMLRSMHHRPGFVVVRATPGRKFHHVYFGVYTDRGFFPLDPQVGTPPGQHSRHFEKLIVPV